MPAAELRTRAKHQLQMNPILMMPDNQRGAPHTNSRIAAFPPSDRVSLNYRNSGPAIATPWATGAMFFGLLFLMAGNPTSNLYTGVSAVLAMLLAGCTGFRLGASTASIDRLTTTPDDPSQTLDAQRALLVSNIPLWVRQLETVRREGDGAIAALAQSFQEVVEGLENSLSVKTRAAFVTVRFTVYCNCSLRACVKNSGFSRKLTS